MRRNRLPLIVALGLVGCEVAVDVPAREPVELEAAARRTRIEQALRRLGGSADPVASARDVVHASFTARGELDGLWAWRPQGLTARRAGERHVDALARFLRDHRDLYAIPVDEPGLAAHLAALGSPAVEVVEIRGKTETNLRFQPRLGGVRVGHREILATFVDDRLASITGSIALPTLAPPAAPALDPAAAEAVARAAVLARSRSGPVGDVTRRDLLIDDDGRLAYELRLGDTAGVAAPYVVRIDAQTGGVTAAWPEAQRGFYHADATYRIIVPDDYRPWLGLETVRTGARSWVEDSVVFPWLGILPSTSPVYVFSSAVAGNGTYTQTAPYHDFVTSSREDVRRFKVQQLTYWSQRAMYVADLFGSDLLADRPHRFLGVRAVDLPDEQAPCDLLGGACWRETCATSAPASQPAQDLPCILFTLFGDSIPSQDHIFHELGHHHDHKLRAHGSMPFRIAGYEGTCDLGTDDESNSTNETIANAFALATSRYLLGGGTVLAASEYEGAICWGTDDRGCFNGMGPNQPTDFVHLPGDDDRLACPPATCEDTYGVGKAFFQAFWESSFGLNCFFSPCYPMAGDDALSDATSAMFYASYHTPGYGTHPQLSGAFLSFYYNYVSEAAWSDRWWVFNHHGLVGPKYGYSKCHL